MGQSRPLFCLFSSFSWDIEQDGEERFKNKSYQGRCDCLSVFGDKKKKTKIRIKITFLISVQSEDEGPSEKVEMSRNPIQVKLEK